MTEWEQLKKEYRELPIPSDGPHQVLEAMARAKKQRTKWKNITHYSAVAAAVLLVVLLVPGMFLFIGGFGNQMNDAAMESADMVMQDKADLKQECVTGESDMALYANGAAKTETLDTAAPEMGEIEESMEDKVWWADSKEAISQEILCQMEERMQKDGVTYFIKSEAYPDGFELISEEQPYYINKDGLLVFVFAAGTVAPKEQKEIEFVIPAEVAAP